MILMITVKLTARWRGVRSYLYINSFEYDAKIFCNIKSGMV